jgi:hypothetical protein
MLHSRNAKSKKVAQPKAQLRTKFRKPTLKTAKRKFSTEPPQEITSTGQTPLDTPAPEEPPVQTFIRAKTPGKFKPYVVQKGRYSYDTDPDSESVSDLDENQMKIATTLTGELKKRVIAHKLKRPSLTERINTTSDLYRDTDMSSISAQDIGLLIPFDPAIQAQSMRYYLKPELQDEGKGYWMIRPQTVQALDFIDSNTNKIRLHRPQKPGTIYNERVPNLAILYGHSGTSKSFTLAQATEYALKRGDIVLSVSGYDTIHDMDGIIQPSNIPGMDGLYDQMLKSRRVLEEMAIAFPDQLKQIKLQKPIEHYQAYGCWARSEEDRYNAPDDNKPNPEMYPFPDPAVVARPMETEPGETLFDLAAMGAWRVDLAGRAFVDFMEELRTQIQYPTFIAIDDVNALVQKSDYVNPANLRVKLDATRLTYVRALMDAINNPPQRGSTMIATSGKFTAFRVDSFLHRAGTQIRTTTYQLLEHQAMLEHYYTSKIILTPMDIEFFRRSQIVTASQPKALREFAAVQ